MSVIYLKNIRVFAYHGCLAEETKIGSQYRVDVAVKASLEKASKTDALEDTVDYVLLNRIVKEEMAQASKLLEHVCKRIISRIFNEAIAVTEATVTVAKINPPIGGDVEEVAVELNSVR